jgi:mono/diheme cytochrome c family protein
VVPAFSRIAFISVMVILLTGLYQTWRLLDGWSALRDLEWGKALVIKLVLFVALLGLAAVNLLYIKPRLDSYAQRMDRRTREHAAALRLTFRRVVLAEAGLAVVVLLVVGVLTGVTPTKATAGIAEGPFRPFVLDSAAEDLSARLVLSPGRIGPNRFDLTVTHTGGGAIAGDATAVLRVSTLDEDTGIAEVQTERLGAGRFTAAGSYLTTVGFWEISAIVRQPGKDDVTLPFRLSLTEATGRPQEEQVQPAAPLARGRELFQQNCVQCHGDAGRGDGPLASALKPPPVDLTVHVPLHSDGELRDWITNGVPRTAMPAFGGQFSPEEVQAVINYIRELAKQGGQTR